MESESSSSPGGLGLLRLCWPPALYLGGKYIGEGGYPPKPDLERLSPAWKSPWAEGFLCARCLWEQKWGSPSLPPQAATTTLSWSPHCTPTAMGKGETLSLGLKIAFVRAMSRASTVMGALPWHPHSWSLALHHSQAAQPPAHAHMSFPSPKHTPKTEPAPGWVQGDEGAPGQGCSSKEDGEMLRALCLQSSIVPTQPGLSMPPPQGCPVPRQPRARCCTPSCFTTSCKHILPIPQVPLHWQFQHFIVWQSCYSTPLSSPWLWPQRRDPLPCPQHGTTVSLGAGGCRSCSGPRTGT